jgi:hypothetical protein
VILVVSNLTCTDASRKLVYTLNGDSGTNYSVTGISGTGSAANTARQTSNNYGVTFGFWVGASQTNPGISTTHFFNYTGASHKVSLSRSVSNNGSSGENALNVNLWRNTAAITNITLFPDSNTFKIGTTATLFGIKAA